MVTPHSLQAPIILALHYTLLKKKRTFSKNRKGAFLFSKSQKTRDTRKNHITSHQILPPCNYCHHHWYVGDKSYHQALIIMFSFTETFDRTPNYKWWSKEKWNIIWDLIGMPAEHIILLIFWKQYMMLMFVIFDLTCNMCWTWHQVHVHINSLVDILGKIIYLITISEVFFYFLVRDVFFPPTLVFILHSKGLGKTMVG